MENLLNIQDQIDFNYNLPLLSHINYGNNFQVDSKNYIIPQKRKDSFWEELLKYDENSLSYQEEEKSYNEESFSILENISISINSIEEDMFKNIDSSFENKSNSNKNLGIIRKKKINKKIKSKKIINKVENKKIKCNNMSNDKEKILSKVSKTLSYWKKDNYFLIPNIFKLLSKNTENNNKTKIYNEFQEYSRKEILVQPNGMRVTDYVSILKNND